MKRREFVIKSGLATAAIGTSSAVLSNYDLFKGANDTVNLGIIGTGSRGAGLIPFINSIKNLGIVACCDVLPEHLANGIQISDGKPKGYATHKELLEDKNVDAVLVAVPFSMHAMVEQDALEAGKHVYGEKTMAKGYTGIQNLLAAQRPELVFQTGHQYHSSRLYSHVVDLIRDGKIGRIAAFECQWNRSGNWRRKVSDPVLERLINWRMYREYSGGLVAELCSHQIDFVNWVTQSNPLNVMGSGGVDFYMDGRETYDNIHVTYKYPEGIRANFTCLTNNAMGDYQIKVMGDRGTLILDYNKAWFYPEGEYEKKKGNVDGVAGATIQWQQGKGIPIEYKHEDPSKQALIDFRDNIINKKMPESNAISGGKAAIAVQMALDAMDKEETIRWKPEYDEWLTRS